MSFLIWIDPNLVPKGPQIVRTGRTPITIDAKAVRYRTAFDHEAWQRRADPVCGWGVNREGRSSALLCVHRPAQLVLVHGGAAFHSQLLGLVVQLVPGPALGPAVRPEPSSPGGRDVRAREPGRGLGLTLAGSLLLDRAGRDLL